MRHLKTEGIILGHFQLNDNDKIITILTPHHGKIKITAKGSKKILSHFTGHLETLNLCHFEIYQGTKNNILTQCRLIYPFPSLLNQMEKINGGLYLSEILCLNLAENEPCLSIFSLLKNILFLLPKISSEKTSHLLIYFNLNFLSSLGLLAALINCQSCRKKISNPENYLVDNAFLICSTCYRQKNLAQKLKQNQNHLIKSIHLNTLKLIKFIKENPLNSILKLNIPPSSLTFIQNLSQTLFENHAGKPIHSLKLI